jgi:hypothetical protein
LGGGHHAQSEKKQFSILKHQLTAAAVEHQSNLHHSRNHVARKEKEES